MVEPRTTSLEALITARLNRRGALQGLLAVASTTAAGRVGIVAAAEQTGSSTLTFTEIKHDYTVGLRVPPGYDSQVLIRWGDAVASDAPPFDVYRQTAAAQEKQFGYNNDFVAFMPLPRGSQNSEHGLLCVNHEYTNGELMFPGLKRETKAKRMTKDQVDVELAAHGLSVVEIRRVDGRWRTVPGSRYNRRFTMATAAMRVSGPAAGHRRLQTSADPTGKLVLGTLNNCSGGVTPWGTVLSGEENFHFYFGGNAWQTSEAHNHRFYEVAEFKPRDENGKLNSSTRYAWPRFHDRFHVEKEPHEPNRFGWVVEYDPYHPQCTPVKRTALGRMRHEGATTSISHDGRIAVYMADDAYFQCLYKFVSNTPLDLKNPSANADLLDDGVLYAAKFTADGKVAWLPLVFGSGPLTPEFGFDSQADVLIETRRAARLLGATPMDRPEDVEENPGTGKVYIVLTNNVKRTDKQLDAANPRPKNKHGHVIELTMPMVDGKPDHTATICDWDIFLRAGNPASKDDHAEYHPATSANGWLSCPDNCAFDPAGRLWLATDGATDTSKATIADGLYACDTRGPSRALTKLFFQAPKGAEVCGPCFTPDGKTLFLAVQHPGEEEDIEPKERAKGHVESTYDHPSTRWPDFAKDMPPRPAIVAITKKDGGAIGT